MIIKINNFRGDLSDISAKTATLAETSAKTSGFFHYMILYYCLFIQYVSAKVFVDFNGMSEVVPSKELSQPSGHPQHAWLHIADTYILVNETKSDCDDGAGVPQVVDGVHGIESDDDQESGAFVGSLR